MCRTLRATQLLALTALLCLGLPGPLPAHEIPNDVTVQAFLKPEGQILRLLMRVPLKAMRDVEFPIRGPGYLELVQSSRMDNALREGAQIWISDAIEVYESDTRLPRPRIAAALLSVESDKSFLSYEAALAHVQGERLPVDLDLVWNQAM